MSDGRNIQVALSPAPDLDQVHYPDSDGKPMGETPLHIRNISYTLISLEAFFENDPMVFVAGNMFVYYEQGNRNRHVSPDIFVVRGTPKITTPMRRRYLLWENKPLDFALEMTSESTRNKDLDVKMHVYRDVLKVPEYFLFDPHEEYLTPPLQGYRLAGGVYVPIGAVSGRLPSEVLGLHLEYHDGIVRLYNPATGSWLPTAPEERLARLQSEAERERADKARKAAEDRAAEIEKGRKTAEDRAAEAEKARKAAVDELERLRRELEELRQRTPPPNDREWFGRREW